MTVQQLMEQAVTESLREIALSAAQAPGGSSRSIESIVRGVAGKLMEEVGTSITLVHAPQPTTRTPRPPRPLPEPLLLDLQATPWVVWREGSPQLRLQDLRATSWGIWREGSPEAQDDVGAGASSAAADEAIAEAATTADEESVPEDASRRSQQSSSPMQSFAGLEPQPWYGEEVPMVGFSGGPEGQLVVREGLTIGSNSKQHLMMQWQGRPRTVLMVAKPGDRLVVATLQDMAAWLSSQGMVVVLEPQLLADQPDLRSTLQNARTFSRADRLERAIDLVITIGGDGTLTWAVSLFRGAMPPVLSFAAGSLGFLTPFPLDGWVRTLTRLLDLHRARGPMPLTCRMRLRVTVHRRGAGPEEGQGDDDEEQCLQVQCLNEVLVHRGQSGTLAKLDVGVDGERVTLVQGDGLILATPTGSTAYSLAAGGSMVHPAVPAILLTPVSPHSLSFRPAVLPDSAVVTIGVPLTARCGAALSVDGKDICALRVGDSVEVATSPHPVPTICRTTETRDWFASVHEALQWNGRMEQK